MEDGEWRMENGEWRMENGEWRMENGEWRMENLLAIRYRFSARQQRADCLTLSAHPLTLAHASTKIGFALRTFLFRCQF